MAETTKEKQQDEVPVIWVEKDKHHTAIIFPQSYLQRYAPDFIPAVLSPIANKDFVRLGWGDRDYYGSSKKNVYKLLKALFFPTRAVMEVTGFDRVEDAGDTIVSISSDKIDHRLLLNNIQSYFYRNKQQQIQLLRKEADGCWYYRAKGMYFIFRNCNNWTARMLKQAGISSIHHWYTFLSPLVMWQINRTINRTVNKKNG